MLFGIRDRNVVDFHGATKTLMNVSTVFIYLFTIAFLWVL